MKSLIVNFLHLQIFTPTAVRLGYALIVNLESRNNRIRLYVRHASICKACVSMLLVANTRIMDRVCYITPLSLFVLFVGIPMASVIYNYPGSDSVHG